MSEAIFYSGVPSRVPYIYLGAPYCPVSVAVACRGHQLDGFETEHHLPRSKEWAQWPGDIPGSDMTVRGTPSPLITAVAEAGHCFCKPRFLYLFNGEVALPGAAV